MALLSNDLNCNEKVNKQQFAYDAIKQAIVENIYKPDTLLVERTLCAALGISRTPVREALKRLCFEGYVVSIPEKGMFVSKIRLEDMIEIYEIREALEKMAIRLLVERKNNDVVKQLEECFDSHERAFKAGTFDIAMHKDVEFHHIYVKGCRNKRLADYLMTIYDQNDRLAFSISEYPEVVSFFMEQHRKILSAVKASDPTLAALSVEEHIVSVKNFVFEKRHMF